MAHVAKREARRQAWGTRSNPFSRGYSYRGAADEESVIPIAHAQSNDELANNYHPLDFQGAPRANTAPPASASSEKPPQSSLPVGDQGQESSKESKVYGDTLATNGASTNGTRELETTTSDGVPRQRKKKNKLLAMFSKKNKEDDTSDAQQTDLADKKPQPKITFASMLKVTVFGSWINVLLVAVPVGIALEYAHVNKVIVFVVNFIAIIPLAAMLSYATEEIALRVGETLGGLLNATFGNAVELIVSVIALFQNKIAIVQTSLVGSMLSNLLLVLGMCFFFGGLSRTEQFFNITVAQTASSLLALAVGSLIIPTAFQIFAGTRVGVQEISRGTSIILLLVYGCYLFFQLKTHATMYNAPSQKVAKNKKSKKREGEANSAVAMLGAHSAATAGGQVNQQNLVQEPDDADVPRLTIVGALITLGASTVLVALCAEFMVSSIDSLTTGSNGIKEEFVGLILLPIVGNAAEHATAVTVACKDKMDLAIGVAAGSSMQIALLVLPLMVVIGWIAGKNDVATNAMTLDFDGFQISVLFISVLLTSFVISDGKSHWLEGALLMATYLIIAVAAFWYPASGVAG
ncbi:hypothetical protein LTR66_007879 [Elasticomyces elasticus]|nr:hypothetical protein LTR66_007879 [Elasticomyces elasticus]